VQDTFSLSFKVSLVSLSFSAFSTRCHYGEHLNTEAFAAILNAVNEPAHFGANS